METGLDVAREAAPIGNDDDEGDVVADGDDEEHAASNAPAEGATTKPARNRRRLSERAIGASCTSSVTMVPPRSGRLDDTLYADPDRGWSVFRRCRARCRAGGHITTAG
jgi:hypothetical protein